MAKGAAKHDAMSDLHSKLAEVFIGVLKGYEAKADMLTKAVMEDELTAELLEALGSEPSPAMLSSIARFLKDNSISFDTEEIEELSALEQRLKDNAGKRPDLVSLTTLRVVENG